MLGDLPTLPTRVYGHGMGSKEPAYDTVPSYKKKKEKNIVRMLLVSFPVFDSQEGTSPSK